MMRPAKALERPPCRTGASPLNDAVERVLSVEAVLGLARPDAFSTVTSPVP
jgi:hypothetical protein